MQAEPLSHAASGSDGESDLVQITNELIEAIQEGRAPDRSGLLTRFPEHAQRLEGLIEAAELVIGLGAPSDDGRSASSLLEPSELFDVPCRLGDFEIGRELGKGGMGVVYEARQISLQRQVALKILPFASVLDPRQLQRFKNEALAAAQLNHPHIVDVYGIGCERGVHYYAMRLIEGHSLAEVLDELRQTEVGTRETETAHGHSASPQHQPDAPARDEGNNCIDHTSAKRERGNELSCASNPSLARRANVETPAAETPRLAALSTDRNQQADFFRTIARLGIDAAEALHHAHEQGVIHRDVKPSNLMIDNRGQLWVTDFGLAHVETGAGLTITGELLGTLRYMSPEQATGQRLGVDHRTDVYSLGVTLYELLTFQPPFRAATRSELLQQILFQEPRPLRKVRRDVPIDLETIVLKCLEKSAADRYATAADVAEDLQRFIELEPIRARRASFRQRTGKWARRHAALIVTGSIATALVSLVASVLIMANHAEVVRQRNRADEQARLAREVVDKFYTDLAEQWMSSQVELTDLQREFLDKALAFYEDAAEQVGNSPSDQIDAARALLRLAAIYNYQSRQAQAETAATRAIDLYEELLASDPTSVDYRRGLADANWILGRTSTELHHFPESIAAHVKQISILSRLCAEQTDSTELRWQLAHAKVALGTDYRWQHRYDKAEAELSEAVAIERELVNAEPDNFHLKALLGVACHDLAALLSETGRTEEAEATYREALQWKTEGLEGDASNREYINQLAYTKLSLGRLLKSGGRYDEAEELWRDALENQAALLVERFPTIQRYRDGYSVLSGAIGEVERARGNLDGAIAAFRQALVVDPEFAEGHCILADALRESGQLNDAIIEYRKAIELNPDLALPHFRLGSALMEQGAFQEGLSETRRAHELGSRTPDWRFDSARWVRDAERLVELESHWPAILAGTFEPGDAAEQIETAQFSIVQKHSPVLAARLYRDALTQDPSLADDLNSGNRYNAACAAVLASIAESSGNETLSDAERTAWCGRALEWLTSDLDAWSTLADSTPGDRDQISQAIAHWQIDPDLAAVRDDEPLARLPEDEQRQWRKLWRQVGELQASLILPAAE